jgi:hypothetical protein
MTDFDQATAAIPKAKALIERLGGVVREIVPDSDEHGWLLRVRTASPIKWPDRKRITEIDHIRLVLQSDFDRPAAALPRTTMTDAELLALPRFRGRIAPRP